MSRTIRYKEISKEMSNLVKPAENNQNRKSIGLDKDVGEYFYIKIESLIPFKNQARKVFDENELDMLAESIKEYGIRQPLTVIQSDNDKYEIVSGERRILAAAKIGLEKVPCIILKDSSQADGIALVENIHRKNLHPIELGCIYKKLLENRVFKSQVELSKKISASESQISEFIKYASLSQEVQSHILENNISSRNEIRKYLKKPDQPTSKDATTKDLIVLNITNKNGEFAIKDFGIQQLSMNDKEKLRSFLFDVIDTF